MQTKRKGRKSRRAAAVLTAAVLTAVWMPIYTKTATAVSYNTATAYVLRSDNQYLSVSGGEAGEGVVVSLYEADGAAFYNGWYFEEAENGVQIRSAIDDGSYYLAESNGTLFLSQTAGLFQYTEDGVLSAGSVSLSLIPEAITGCISGDVDGDGILSGMDLAKMRQLLLAENADFVEAAVGDADGSGTFDAADAALLQRYLLGEDITLSAVNIPGCSIVPAAQDPVQTDVTTETTTTTITEMTTTTTEPFWYDENTTATTAVTTTTTTTTEAAATTTTAQQLTLDDMPSDYVEPMEWIWENRMEAEGSTERWNLIFDQIIAGDGALNYVVRWQSYKTLTLTQRQEMEVMLEDAINDWTDWLVGYDDWPYDHVDVNIVGWAVLDADCLEDLQEDEVVYTDTAYYDSSGDTSNGTEEIPSLLPNAPSELWRFEHFTDSSYEYPGTRFDMCLWATQGWPSIGGAGGDWGQRLSDDAYLNILADDTGVHVLVHEMGHGFGLTDFYGENGASDGPPPDGFPDDGTSIMMAGSSTEITNFDGWMLRYTWSMIKDEEGRFSY